MANPITNVGKTTIKATGGFLTFITNYYVFIIIAVIFFPMNIANFIILFVVNAIITLANIVLFLAYLLIWIIMSIVVVLINVIISIFNNFSITIPIPAVPDPTINFPDLPTLGYPTFPTLGVIPYMALSDVSIFPNKVLLFYILDLLGISWP